jgi:MoxR-like ATPase
MKNRISPSRTLEVIKPPFLSNREQQRVLQRTLKIRLLSPNFQGTLKAMIRREAELARVEALLRRYPVVALIGARQVGKTTLARQIARRHGPASFFDLENPEHLARLSDPWLSL